MTTGGVTTVIDRLEQAGYVRRRDDATDRRRILIEATERAARMEGEIFGELIRNTAQLVGSYSRPELEVIRDFLERGGRQLTAHNDWLSDSARPGKSRRKPRTASKRKSQITEET